MTDAEHSGRDHPELHAEAFAWLMAALDDAERDEFYDGLRQLAHRFVDIALTVEPDRAAVEAFMGDLLGYVESWMLSVKLAGDPAWGAQVAAGEAAWTAGQRTTVSVSDLRATLGV